MHNNANNSSVADTSSQKIHLAFLITYHQTKLEQMFFPRSYKDPTHLLSKEKKSLSNAPDYFLNIIFYFVNMF